MKKYAVGKLVGNTYNNHLGTFNHGIYVAKCGNGEVVLYEQYDNKDEALQHVKCRNCETVNAAQERRKNEAKR